MDQESGDKRELPRELPTLERGKDLSRIFAFTDGVFAIAITLLVLQIEVPTGATGDSSLWNALADESPDFTAFVISFIVIGMYWVGSHRFMRTVDQYDQGLMLLTLMFLFFIVLIPFSSQLMGEYGSDAPISIVIYIVNLACVAAASGLMHRHVLRAGMVNPAYAWDVELSTKSIWFTTVVFLLTIPLAFILGTWALLLWIGLRWDPFQAKRDRIYKAAKAGKAAQ